MLDIHLSGKEISFCTNFHNMSLAPLQIYNIVMAIISIFGSVYCIYITIITLRAMYEHGGLSKFYTRSSATSQISFCIVSITYLLYFVLQILSLDDWSLIPLFLAVLLSPVGSCTLVVFFIGRLYYTFSETPYSISKRLLIILATLTTVGTIIAETSVALYVAEQYIISFIGISIAISILLGMCYYILVMFSQRLLQVM